LPVHYRFFGLTVACDRAIRTLEGCRLPHGASFDGPVDVEIVAGTVAAPEGGTLIEDLLLSGPADDLTISIEESGRFRVRQGRRITYDPWPGAGEDEVDLYLTGSVLGALLHQRSILPMHCNAIRMGDAAVLFCGESGAGKSTLAAWFQARGHPLFTDDVCALTFDDGGGVMAHPGLPRLRLRQQSLDLLGLGHDGLSRIPWNEDKFEMEMTLVAAREALPVAAIYHLCTTEDGLVEGIHPLHGLDAVNAITANIYRRRIADIVGRGGGYLGDTVRMVAEVPIFSVNRTWDLAHYEAEALTIEAHARASVALWQPTAAPIDRAGPWLLTGTGD
jgi:hypothetical protein